MLPSTDPNLYLQLHHAHAEELRSEARAYRLARMLAAGDRHRRLGSWRVGHRPVRAPAVP